MSDLDELIASTRNGVLVALKRDGRPQLSNVTHLYEPERKLIRVSSTADRAKVANLRRDPRGSLYVTSPDFRRYAVAEGRVEVTPTSADPHDATVEELIEVYRAVAGEHPDWEDYRAAMVRDGRVVIRLHVERVYGARGW
ncbi:PPOX class F420-dependent oxidoreductase [Streptacidiphilus monticola]|uniref:PPOX class F420-dependent oxidoreductase n=1 Tax=Streptacidiphilus monticola TaxID=2161674 RepID=A0ABW1G4E4_9ACTN